MLMAAQRGNWRASGKHRNIPVTVALVVLDVLFVFPLLWMFEAAFNAHASLVLDWPAWTFHNVVRVLTRSDTLRPLLNSFLLAGGATVVVTATGVLAAYSLARGRYRFRHALMLLILLGTGLPVAILMIPAYSMFAGWSLLDSMWATILLLSATSLPFAIWILKNSIDQIPLEIEEAARVDGASTFKVMLYQVIPLATPGIAVTALFTFMTNWGEFVIPFTVLQSPSKLPVAVSIYQFLSAHGNVLYGPLAAYALVFSVPVLLLYRAMAQDISGAFTFGGGVKG